MINLNNILDNLKEKINKLKIELLNVKNNLDKISNIPTLIVILETDLTKLDLDTFKKSFSLLESNIDDDIRILKSFKEIYQFLKDPEIENIGIKKGLNKKPFYSATINEVAIPLVLCFKEPLIGSLI